MWLALSEHGASSHKTASMERTKSGHIFSLYTGKKITNRTYAPSHVWRATPKKEIDFASFFVCVLHWLGQYLLFPVFFEEGRVRKTDSKRAKATYLNAIACCTCRQEYGSISRVICRSNSCPKLQCDVLHVV